MICQQIFAILALVLFFLKILLKVLQNRFFPALASRSGFGAAISDTIASRLLGAAAACVILLSCAAEDRKSYWSGCIKAATVISSSTGK